MKKSVPGRYDGNVVILEGKAPVDHEAKVVVTFLEGEDSDSSRTVKKKKWRWAQSRKIRDDFPGSMVELLLKERREHD